MAPAKLTRPGNILKIVIIGPSEAGKTTYLKQIDKEATEFTDKKGRTIGPEIGKIYYDPNKDTIIKREQAGGIKGSVIRVVKMLSERGLIEVRLFGTPGQPRFEAVREAIMRGADGVLFVIDSTRPDQVGDALMLLQEVKTFLPEAKIVLVANKQDLEAALPPNEVVKFLSINGVKAFPTSALKGWNLEAPLKQLIKMILGKQSGEGKRR